MQVLMSRLDSVSDGTGSTFRKLIICVGEPGQTEGRTHSFILGPVLKFYLMLTRTNTMQPTAHAQNLIYKASSQLPE